MNEHEFEQAFKAWSQAEASDPASPDLRARVLEVPNETPQRRSWLPGIDTRGFNMYSALKFIASGVIVALFGGFLLAGVFTTQQDDEVAPAAVTASPEPGITDEPTEAPTTSVRSDILPGVDLTVEGVEPGVFQVLHDGVRDLAKANDTDVVTGHDGGVYLLRPQRFVRLGNDQWQAWATKKPEVTDFEVAPDGTVWTVQTLKKDTSAIQSFDGEEWTEHQRSWGEGVVEVTSDGTVWAVWEDTESDTTVVGYLGADGWTAVGGGLPGRLHVSDSGDIWSDGGGPFVSHVHRYVDGDWQWYEDVRAARFDVGPDGTFWGPGNSGGWGAFDGIFYRFDGTEWMTFEGPDWMPEGGEKPDLDVASDGSVWVGPVDTGSVCRGVGHFDGVTWDRYLSHLCVEAIDLTPNGAVWLLAKEPDADLRHVYVITPEAVAATE